MTRHLLPLVALVLLGGCAAQQPAARVTRFHLDQPIARSSYAIEPRAPASQASLEFAAAATAVSRAMTAQGFVPAIDPARSELIALVEVGRSTRPVGPARTPGSIGIGIGTGGGGFGVGGSVEIPIGKAKAREATRTELFVQLKRRGDGQPIWEGRAIDEGSGTDPAATLARLADALFKGFPGESGRTITVK